jgi:hypothetical protein
MAAGQTYDSIATVTLGSDTNTVTFSSIPSTYTDLILVVYCKNATSAQGTYLRVNSDTGSNYARTVFGGNGSTTFGGTNASFTYYDAMYMGTTFATAIIHFLNYSNTTTFKTFLGNAAGGEVNATAGLWRSTSAINAISLQPSGGNYSTGSRFSLYGIAAA